jgi:hypothetical protein
MQAFTIPDKVLIEINRLCFRFLWRKRDCNRKAFEKVKRVVMCADYEQGGLKMIDIRQMQESFLLQWVIRLCQAKQEEKWTDIPRILFSHFGNNYECFYAKVQSKNFKGVHMVGSPFWQSVLKTWLNNKSVEETTSPSTSLWNNHSITYRSEVLFFPSWIKAGIMKVNDMIEGNNVISFDALCRKIDRGASRYLEYEIIYSALNTYLRKHTDADTIIDNNIPTLCNKNIHLARDFRKLLVDRKVTATCSERFWMRKLNVEINRKFWLLAFKSTQETRLRVLQWKLLHNIYPTNILLSKMKIRATNKCLFCVDVVDYIEHFFYECPIVLEFWKRIEQYLWIEFNIKIVLNVREVLFGISRVDGLTDTQLYKINHIILIAKMCISIYKKTELKTPLTYVFVNQARIRGFHCTI